WKWPVQASDVDHAQAIRPADPRGTTEDLRPAQMTQLIRAVQDRDGPGRHSERPRPRLDLALVESSRSLVKACEHPAEKSGTPLEWAPRLFEKAARRRPLVRNHLFPARRLTPRQINPVGRNIGGEHVIPLQDLPKDQARHAWLPRARVESVARVSYSSPVRLNGEERRRG